MAQDDDPLAVALAARRSEDSHPLAADGRDHLSRAEALLAKYESDEQTQARIAKEQGQASQAALANPSPWMQRQMANNPPIPAPSLAHEFAQSAKEVGEGGVKSLEAIPVAAGDAFTGGLLPRAEEAVGLVPKGWNQRVMDEGGAGALVGQMAGLGASALAGPLRGVGAGVDVMASQLARSPLQQALLRNAGPAAIYSGADTAVRGGSIEDVGRNAGAAGLAGLAFPAAGAAVRKFQGARAESPVLDISAQTTNLPEHVDPVAATTPPAQSESSKTVTRSLERKAQQLLDDSVKGAAIKGTNKLERNQLIPGAEGITTEGDELEASGGARAVAAAAQRQGLDRDLLGTVPKFTRALLEKRKAVGEEIGKFTAEGVLPTDGVRLIDVLRSLQESKNKTAPDTPEFDALTARMQSIVKAYKPDDVPAYAVKIPLWQMQGLSQAAAKQGYGTEGRTFVDPKEPARIAREVHRALRNPLYDEINNTLLAHPELGSPEKFAALRQKYTDLSGLADIAISARPKAYLGRPGLIESVQELGKGIADHKFASGGAASAYGAGYAMGGHGLATAMAVPIAAKPILQHLDNKLAQLVLSARRGLPPSDYSAMADKLGVDPAMAAKVWRTFRGGVLGISAQSAPDAEAQSQGQP